MQRRCFRFRTNVLETDNEHTITLLLLYELESDIANWYCITLLIFEKGNSGTVKIYTCTIYDGIELNKIDFIVNYAWYVYGHWGNGAL